MAQMHFSLGFVPESWDLNHNHSSTFSQNCQKGLSHLQYFRIVLIKPGNIVFFIYQALNHAYQTSKTNMVSFFTGILKKIIKEAILSYVKQY